MTNRKIHPDGYHLSPEEIEDLRDWSLETFAKLEAISGEPVRLVRNEGTPFTSAKEAWEARKRERDQERRRK